MSRYYLIYRALKKRAAAGEKITSEIHCATASQRTRLHAPLGVSECSFTPHSPLEVYAETAVRREEASLDEVQLVVVLEQQGQSCLVPLRCAHRLREKRGVIG